MKIVHIESGLGNQMLSYCEYLALRKMNPDDDIYIETITYDIPECSGVFCQWYGYELERIFGIKEPRNVKEIIPEEQWKVLVDSIRKSEFWLHNWNYPVAFTEAFHQIGIPLINMRGNLDPPPPCEFVARLQDWAVRLKSTRWAHYCKRKLKPLVEKRYLKRYDDRALLFLKTDQSIFTGQRLSFLHRGNSRELIDQEIQNIFQFPPFTDERNMQMQQFLSTHNAVAIHARRGDMTPNVWWCYQYGYFKRAVRYIRKKVEHPVFVLFTNTESVTWCKQNLSIFGLDPAKDKLCFVDWNKGQESFRDMQLMSYCQHAIITSSSFGWWGAYFIKNPDKITISPDLRIDTTYHC